MSVWNAQVRYRDFNLYLKDFNKFDEDNNGGLNWDEVKKLVESQLERAPTDKELQDYFKTTDLDGDRRINLPEYITSIVGEYDLVPDSLPPPPPLWVPPEIEEEVKTEQAAAEPTRTWSQAEINLRCKKSNELVTKIMKEITELNQKEIEEAFKHNGGRTLDEPSYDSDGSLRDWHLNNLGLKQLPEAFGDLQFNGDVFLGMNKLKTCPKFPDVKGDP